MTWRPEKELGVTRAKIRLASEATSMLPLNRHNLVRTALKEECTHLLFLDTDMKFPHTLLADMLTRMIKRPEVQVLAMNCTKRAKPVEFIAHDFDGKIIDSRGKFGMQKVRQVGAAVMLIDLSIFREGKILPPFFMMEWIPDLQTYCGEDIYFCQLLNEAGYDIWIDHEMSRKIHHVGRYPFGAEDVEDAKP